MLWMNTVGPYHNRQETYTYYSLPFCKGNYTYCMLYKLSRVINVVKMTVLSSLLVNFRILLYTMHTVHNII